MIHTPLTYESIDHLKPFINNNIKGIIIFYDIQNLSIGKYDAKLAEHYFVQDIDPQIHILNESFKLLQYISRIRNVINEKLGLPSYMIFYTDNRRNILNQTLLPDWKANRKKAYATLDEVQKQYITFSKTIVNTTYKILKELSKYSMIFSFIELEYIDSDFVPYFIYETQRNNFLYIIISSDHDYYHMLNLPNMLRYISSTQTRKELKQYFESRYNSYLSIKRKYKINTDEAKHIAKYYSIYHSLIGDSSDSIKPLIKRKSIKYWLKQLINKNFDSYINDILDKKVIIPQLQDIQSDVDYKFYPKPKTKYDEFILRMLIFDFYFISNYISHNPDKRNIELIESKLPKQSLEILKQTKKTIYNQLYNKIQDITTVLSELKQFYNNSQINEIKQLFEQF